MEINTSYWFDVLDEPNQEITPCENCVYPEACIRQCAIQSYFDENVAEIRGETRE